MRKNYLKQSPTSEAKHFYYANHLLNDIKYWLSKRSGIRDDKVGYRANVKCLLDSENVTDFQ